MNLPSICDVIRLRESLEKFVRKAGAVIRSEQKKSRVFLSIMFLTTVIVCASLLGACNSKPNQDVVYENDKYGFSLNLPGDFAQKVDIKEDGSLIYFVDKEVQAKHPEQVFGVVGRIETYDKKEFSRENLKELEDMYSLRYLKESGSYHFGWAHATDVQVPADASEKTIQDFRACRAAKPAK